MGCCWHLAGPVLQPLQKARLSLFCQIERRLDTVRSMCHHSHKRVMACFQGQHGTDTERRYVSSGCDSGAVVLVSL
uniref:Uncharacterized protein n=1 Tax=Ailuropoda melanoleuca TaxID=9646 RepID=A0A7N5JCC1_AILME